MYQMTPLFFRPDDGLARHTDTLARAVLLVLATIAILALAAVVLAAASAGWLRMIEWCRAELNPISCSLYLAGI